MKAYYLQSEYQPGKHRIVNVCFDIDDPKFDPSVLSPYLTVMVDELNTANRALCVDLLRTCNKIDANGEGKYYVDDSGQIFEITGWTEFEIGV